MMASGDRISVAVAAGWLYITRVAYRLNKRGEPAGASKVDTLTRGLSQTRAIELLNEYAAAGRIPHA